MKLALFDFDGTIIKRDSMFDFMRFINPLYFYVGIVLLSPFLLAYLLRIINKTQTKEKIITYFLGGKKKEYLDLMSQKYAHKIDKIIIQKAKKRIAWHTEKGHHIVIVSASAEIWLSQWCLKNNYDLIATKLEVANGIFTGKLSSKNCHGEEKVNRIKSMLSIKDYEYIYAYGDTQGDRPMLALANASYYKVF